MPASRSRIVAEVDFAKNGRQTGYLRLFHSVHASAYGFIPIPIVVLKNGDGPTALGGRHRRQRSLWSSPARNGRVSCG